VLLYIGALDDFVFYATTQTGFAESSSQATNRLSDIIRAVFEYVRLDSSINMPDDVSDSAVYDMVVELVDGLLESADELMDSMEGRLAKAISNNASLSLAIDKDRLLQSGSLDIPKPQLKFLAEIDNTRENPFRPKLRSKPHALVPLNLQDTRARLDLDDDDGDLVCPSVYHPHPYEAELQRLKYTPAQVYVVLFLCDKFLLKLFVSKYCVRSVASHYLTSSQSLLCKSKYGRREPDLPTRRPTVSVHR
jgi:exosome complex exonuclease RRP6